MKDINRLAANIRSLRRAYGETQEKLGEAIGEYTKSTISFYETGQRAPDKETLLAIARHYTVSVEELLYSDFSFIGKITVDKDAFLKNVDIILPIISSDKAMQNENFKRAFKAHKTFYDQLHMANLDGIDNMDVCIDGYMATIEDDSIKAEASANILALWYIILLSIKTGPLIIKNRPAAFMQVVTKDEQIKKVIENIDPDFEADAKDMWNEIADDVKKEMSKMLIAIKQSKDLSDLANYYLALQYVYNLVDNDLDWGFNQRIGVEMMKAFVSVKNIFATRFSKIKF